MGIHFLKPRFRTIQHGSGSYAQFILKCGENVVIYIVSHFLREILSSLVSSFPLFSFSP